jgi:hypothetical protein
MPDERSDDLRDCPTAYECRDRLPELSSWMSDDELKQVTIWRGTRFEPGQQYFDLDNPSRGPFVATGDEHPPTGAYLYLPRRRPGARLGTSHHLGPARLGVAGPGARYAREEYGHRPRA